MRQAKKNREHVSGERKKTEREREAKKNRACFWREGADFAVSRLLRKMRF